MQCPNCGRFNYDYPKNHECPPMWQVGIYKDELEPTYGDDLLEAAERYVEDYHWSSAEWDRETTVYGIDADGQLVQILVTMEAVPTYSAEIKHA